MKPYFILFVFLLSCNSGDTDTTVEEIESTDSSIVYAPEKLYIWSVDSDSMTKIKNPVVKPEYYNVDTIIKGLNFQYPEIQLKKIKQSNDTLYLGIDDAEYMTQRMGSSGPVFYMANVYFNFTAIPGISYVYLDFTEGDHARPGILTLEDYKHYKEK